MTLDPLAIGLAIALLVALVLIGSRFFPENVNITPWRSGDRPPVVREDDDARFTWPSGSMKTTQFLALTKRTLSRTPASPAGPADRSGAGRRRVSRSRA